MSIKDSLAAIKLALCIKCISFLAVFKFIHPFVADIYIAHLQVELLRSAPSSSAAK